MKRILMAASALAMLAGAASVHAADVQRDFHVNGWVDAACHIHSNGDTVNIGSITDADAHVHHDLAMRVAGALNHLDVTAWCNGNHNGVNLTRTALINEDNSHGNGMPENGFNNAALYDLDINIADATRADGYTPLEGTCDGLIGPGFHSHGDSVSDFGAGRGGAAVTFYKGTDGCATDGEGVSAFPSGKFSRGATSTFTSDNNRLAAGHYHGFVRLLLVPRV